MTEKLLNKMVENKSKYTSNDKTYKLIKLRC